MTGNDCFAKVKVLVVVLVLCVGIYSHCVILPFDIHNSDELAVQVDVKRVWTEKVAYMVKNRWLIC
jgi:hypothetical protein